MTTKICNTCEEKKNKIIMAQVIKHDEILSQFTEEYNYDTYQLTFPKDIGETH